MLDCGIHPGFTGLASLPFLDEVGHFCDFNTG
jgi:hypothetical protein